jgi:hypothetical protein
MRSRIEPVARVPFFGSRVTSPSRASRCRTARTVFLLAERASVSSRSTRLVLRPALTSVDRSRSYVRRVELFNRSGLCRCRW